MEVWRPRRPSVTLLASEDKTESEVVIMGLILLIVLILFLVGALPNWGYHRFGFKPSGIVGVVVLIVVVLLLTGRL